MVEGWQEYRDPGYLRIQLPPGWVLVTTPDYPEYNLRSCHCYWMLMSELMVQNSPSAEDVAAWFDSMGPDDLAPGGALIEILRADSEYAPPVDWGQPFASVPLRQDLVVDYYQLSDDLRVVGYRYRDAQGRPWFILVKTNDVLMSRTNPLRITIGTVLETIDNR
ncbi:hypothetical protein OO015_09725 [Thermomicrobium sp. 4228-Ro]|uniref:hypothetical protein n=1 Tax=Thermomicrobium sp. 4228-Ro TaxID=2993937 RepID=UPI002248DA0B|nr:hypothetical protein [Thermomicrobium sp. 4228-Ro]MCX2727764.1 hypothetical protein [Thermomicrobium sp. 4228-Ro]